MQLATSVKRRPLLSAAAAAFLLLLLVLLLLATTTTLLTDAGHPLVLLPCLPSVTSPAGSSYSSPSTSALAAVAVHYATTSSIPQQSRAELSLALAALRRRAPCRLLVFGLGRDSPLWAALNPGGATVFLEEDPTWFRSVRAHSPIPLRAHIVRYRTRLSDADALRSSYRTSPACLPAKAFLKDNKGCPLALDNLPAEVYDNEWDVLMIDAPKGYFAAAPGRMAAIFSAAVMARGRRGEGDTDVFLHDVDRKVEKAFAREFLCEKYRVAAAGRLWHFRIPPAARRPNETADPARPFC